MSAVIWSAVAGEVAVSQGVGMYVRDHVALAVADLLHHVGAMITPPLAMPAATSAICSGVAETSSWPIAAVGQQRLLVGEEGGWAGRST